MNSQTVWQRTLSFLGSKPVIIETSNSQLTSDAGLLPMREFDEALGFTRRFADALEDTRDVRYTTHSFLEMTRARVFGILADYEDASSSHFKKRMHDKPWISRVMKCVGKHPSEPERLIKLPEGKQPGIGSQLSIGRCNDNRFTGKKS